MLTVEPGHNRSRIVGIALWLGCGLAAFVLARLVPLRRGRAWWGEGLAALFGAGLCGLIATALDFGGTRELDWRAGVFAALGALALAGAARALRKNRETGSVAARKSGGPS